MIRLALGSILPTVLLFMLNHDEDWYEKDLPDWERQTHWYVGEYLRIPKGQDVGLRFFSNLTESIQPIIECATNYDMFRKNAVVAARQQRLPEYMQYDSRTSNLAKFIGEKARLSPAKIDQKQMKEFSKRERKILDDPNLSTDERDKRQLAIQKRRIKLAQRTLR